MRRPLIVTAILAVMGLSAVSMGGRPTSVSAEPNGICAVNPSPLPSVAPNNFTPIEPACSVDRHLQVDVIRGGGSTTSQGIYASPQPSLSPGQTYPLVLDQNGNLDVNVQVFPITTTPPVLNQATTVTNTSSTIMTANTSRRTFQICNPALVGSTVNNQQVFFDVFGLTAVAGTPDQALQPGQCYAPDAVPATTSAITAIESPLPGFTASPVPVTASQQ